MRTQPSSHKCLNTEPEEKLANFLGPRKKVLWQQLQGLLSHLQMQLIWHQSQWERGTVQLKGAAGLLLSETVSVTPCNSLMEGEAWQGLQVKIFSAKSSCENHDASHSNMQNLRVSKYSWRQWSVFSKTAPSGAMTLSQRAAGGGQDHVCTVKPQGREHHGSKTAAVLTQPYTAPSP